MGVIDTNIVLVLRQAKGSELTHEELDSNQSGLKAGIEGHAHSEFGEYIKTTDYIDGGTFN